MYASPGFTLSFREKLGIVLLKKVIEAMLLEKCEWVLVVMREGCISYQENM